MDVRGKFEIKVSDDCWIIQCDIIGPDSAALNHTAKLHPLIAQPGQGATVCHHSRAT